jgi:hypothetical protein
MLTVSDRPGRYRERSNRKDAELVLRVLPSSVDEAIATTPAEGGSTVPCYREAARYEALVIASIGAWWRRHTA